MTHCDSISSDPHWSGHGPLEIECHLPAGHPGRHQHQRGGHFPPVPVITWDGDGGVAPTWIAEEDGNNDPTQVTLFCPICEHTRIGDEDEEVFTGPTLEQAQEQLIDHLRALDPHDGADLAEHIVWKTMR